jgi:hypothetical protein
MARRIRRWHALTALVGCAALSAGVLAAASAPAAAATKPHWTVTYRHKGVTITDLVVLRPKAAWAVGRNGTGSGLLLRSDGSTWTSVTFPGSAHYQPERIWALSATDIWISGQDTASFSSSEMLHLHDGTWSTLTLPGGEPMLVVSDTSIWATNIGLASCGTVSEDSQGCIGTAHWNGSTWTTYPLRATTTDAAARSGSTIWVIGESYTRIVNDSPVFTPDLFTWTGSAWRRVTSVHFGRTAHSPAIVVTSPRDIWVADSSLAHPRACAMHWTGARWSPFFLPGAPGPCNWTASDGKGGLWFNWFKLPSVTLAHWTGGRLVFTSDFRPISSFGTDGFSPVAVPRTNWVMLSGSYCPLTKACPITGVIAQYT